MDVVAIVFVEQCFCTVFENTFHIHIGIVVSPHALNEGVIKGHLLATDLYDLLFGGVFGQELKAKDLVLLSNTMRAREGLNVLMGLGIVSRITKSVEMRH